MTVAADPAGGLRRLPAHDRHADGRHRRRGARPPRPEPRERIRLRRHRCRGRRDGPLPGGGRAVVLNGLHRGVLGAAESDRGRLRVEVEERPDEEWDAKLRELDRVPRDRRGDPRSPRRRRPRRGLPARDRRSRSARGHGRLLAGRSVRAEAPPARDAGPARAARARDRVAARGARHPAGAAGASEEDVEEGAQKQQREYNLRRQMDSIRKELGDDDAFRDRGVPAEARRARAARAGPRAGGRGALASSAWASRAPSLQMIRTYLDWLFSVPWGKTSEERSTSTREVLDADHHGPWRR